MLDSLGKAVLENDVASSAQENAFLKEFADKKVLITGATGLFGVFIACVLSKISNSQNNIVLASRKIEKLQVLQNAGVINATLTNDVFADDFSNKEFDYVFHLASPTNPEDLKNHPLSVVETNIDTPRKLFDKFPKAKFILFSSTVVHGDILPLNDRSSYTISKLALEMIAKSHAKEKGLNYLIVRPSRVYGMPLFSSSETAFSEFIKTNLKGEEIFIQNKTGAKRNWVYVADAVQEIFYEVVNAENGTVKDITSDENFSLEELKEIIETNAFQETRLSKNVKRIQKLSHNI